MKTKIVIHSIGLSLLLGLVVCFFLSIFVNNSSGFSQYNDQYWFLVNRGYPQAWAGTSVPNRSVPWPLVKAPIVKATITHDNYSQTWNKVIDLSRFLPLWFISSLITFPITWILIWAGHKNNQLRIIRLGSYLFATIVVLLLYFFWFPNV